RACTVELNWAMYDEGKVASQFVIETSANGATFTPVQTIPAGSGIAYSHLLERIINQGLTVRIKAEAANGQYVYSEEKTASTNCKNNLEVFLYPNPVSAETTELTLRAQQGIFNGKYNIRITDVAGAEVKRLEVTYTNQVQVKLQTGKLAAGIYLMVITGEDGQQISLKMVRL
ncbi:MAG: T9SS type A sorting domain-containing protein, partial [Ferruginibacter sp.]